MSEAASVRSIGLIVEAAADAQVVRTLVDRLLIEAREWVEPSLLDGLRCWRGAEPETAVTYWKKVRGLARKYNVRSHGHFSGEPGAPDAQAARRALLLFKKLGMVDALVLLRDADDQPERLKGLVQARDESPMADRIAIGVAIPEREAWVLVGYLPSDETERQALAEERARLGFDPSRYPERLRGEGQRSAKLALVNLTRGHHDREVECLEATPISYLRERGARCGLAAFLGEIEQTIVPAIL